MKTSIKLLIGIAIAVLLTMVGTGWSFRHQYDQLDHSDPFAQYSRQTLPVFRVLRVVGSPGEVFLVQPGSAPTLRINSRFQQKIAYRIVGDTLVVQYTPTDGELTDDRGIRAGDALSGLPLAVVAVPALQTVLVENATCKLANWKLASLTISQTGPNGATELGNTIIDDLQATVSGGSLLRTAGKNAINRATVMVKNKATFVAGEHTFAALQLRADSTATVTLPGSLLAKIR
ncbi:MAG: hypothetical protein H7Z72_05340 [Bacteroidetes bacterium]|nr:hypothetical protein [Fibrella sp.]